MKVFLYRFLAVFLLMPLHLFAGETAYIKDLVSIDISANDQPVISPELLYIKDESKKLTVAQVASGQYAGVLENDTFYATGDSAVHWLVLKFHNSSDQPVRRVLSMDENMLYQVSVFERLDDIWKAQHAGAEIPFQERLIQTHIPAFSIALNPGQQQTYYLKIDSLVTEWTATLAVYSEQAFNQYNEDLILKLSLYFGAFAAIIVYNFFLSLMLRERVYIYYVAFSLSFAVFALTYSGYYIHFFSFSELVFNRLPLTSGLFTLFLLLFTREILETGKHFPRLDLVAKYASYVLGFLSIGMLIDVRFFVITKTLGVAVIPLFLTIAIASYFKKVAYSALYLFAFSVYLIGMLLLLLENFDILESNEITHHGYLVGSVIELIMFSTLLSWRIKAIYNERTLAQNRLLELKISEKDRLEKLVLERTDQLNTAVQQAQSASNAKSMFLANMSHEIRTPINVIMGMSELALTGPLGERERNFIEKVHMSSKSLLGIINDVLDLSKVEANKIELVKSQFDLKSLIEEISDMIRFKTDEKDLNYKVEYALPDLKESILEADVTRLRQILLNLLSNAVKFTHTGQVTLKLTQKSFNGNSIEINFAVIDTGIGIPIEDQAKLFQDFTQVDSTTSREYGGTGLGLALSKRLAALMGAEIKMLSIEGIGSEFSFDLTLPVVSKNKQQNVALTGDELMKILNGMHILLVEDDWLNEELAIEILKRYGVTADTAHNGLEAIRQIKRNQYDGVFMDCHMPLMDGFEASRAIRELPEFKDLPIIALTADALEDSKDKILEAGMNDIVTKPIQIDLFVSAMARNFKNANLPDTKIAIASPSATVKFEKINTEELRKNGFDNDFIHKKLKEFATQYASFEHDFLQLLDKNKLKDATTLAHSLKGAAATLGMSEVFTAAQILQIQCQESGADIKTSLTALVSLLKAAIQEINEKI